MTSAQANYNFFANRADSYGSAHYIIGLDGEVLQCIPETEVAYHVGSSQKDPASGRIYTDWCRQVCGKSPPNWVTLGIELCHPDWSGRFVDKTWKAAVNLCADMIKRHGLTVDKIGTHNMAVGWKDCPRWFVNNPDQLEVFRNDVAKLLNSW